MNQVVYSSAATEPFSEAQLTELLARARKNNARLGVSGMLLYHEGSFLQVLEGEAAVLEALFGVISADKRHHRVVALLKREVDERHFGDWRMGFASAKNLPANLPGYSDYLRFRGDPVAGANAALRLMSAFREGRFHSFVQR
jgi:Sensors of blue-light using FAD